jgi:hypothetical protein
MCNVRISTSPKVSWTLVDYGQSRDTADAVLTAVIGDHPVETETDQDVERRAAAVRSRSKVEEGH